MGAQCNLHSVVVAVVHVVVVVVVVQCWWSRPTVSETDTSLRDRTFKLARLPAHYLAIYSSTLTTSGS